MRSIATLLVFGAGLLFLRGELLTASENPVFDGEWTYRNYCAGCHGDTGEGIELFGIPLRGDAYVSAGKAEVIAETIHRGRKYRDKLHPEYSGMPRFQYMRVGEMDALIAYLKGPLQESSSEPVEHHH
jgi:mono/diheme cytochrome c family protein